MGLFSPYVNTKVLQNCCMGLFSPKVSKDFLFLWLLHITKLLHMTFQSKNEHQCHPTHTCFSLHVITLLSNIQSISTHSLLQHLQQVPLAGFLCGQAWCWSHKCPHPVHSLLVGLTSPKGLLSWACHQQCKLSLLRLFDCDVALLCELAQLQDNATVHGELVLGWRPFQAFMLDWKRCHTFQTTMLHSLGCHRLFSLATFFSWRITNITCISFTFTIFSSTATWRTMMSSWLLLDCCFFLAAVFFLAAAGLFRPGFSGNNSRFGISVNWMSPSWNTALAKPFSPGSILAISGTIWPLPSVVVLAKQHRAWSK